MLRGMGFNNNTPIYLASGKIYKAETHLAPLLQLFPLLETKQSLATPEELVPFQVHFNLLTLSSTNLLSTVICLIILTAKRKILL